MKKQYHLFFSGTVQGVGFRFISRRLAAKNQINGWVKNRSDGRVEIIAEGEEKNLDSFLAGLKQKFEPNISGIGKQKNEYTGAYRDFEITF